MSRLISKAIKLGRSKFSARISGVELEEEQAKSIRVEGVRSANDTRLRYCTLKVLHIV